MPSDTNNEVTVREHLEKLIDCYIERMQTEIDLKFAAITDSTAEARRLMEGRMAGFPREFARKDDLEITALAVREIKDKDIEGLKGMIEDKLSRQDYAQRHEILQEKIDRLETGLQDIQNIRSNLQGRIIATGGAVVFIVALTQILLQVIMHIYWGK